MRRADNDENEENKLMLEEAALEYKSQRELFSREQKIEIELANVQKPMFVNKSPEKPANAEAAEIYLAPPS